MLGKVIIAYAATLLTISHVSLAADVSVVSGGELSVYKFDRENLISTRIDILELAGNSIYVQWVTQDTSDYTLIEYGHGIATPSILTGSFQNGIHIQVDTTQLSELVVYAGNGGVIDIAAERVPGFNYELQGTETRSTEREERKFQGSKIVSYCQAEGTAFINDISNANCSIRDNNGVVTVRSIAPTY
jgi:hypothetical protein